MTFLAEQPHLPGPFQSKITAAYSQRFADSRSRVVKEQKHGMISFSVPTPAIHGRDYGAGFLRFQINRGPAKRLLVANG